MLILEKILHWLAAPQLFKTMHSRVSGIAEAYQGLQNGAPPLVSVYDGKFYPAGVGDDLGLYYFVPQMMRLFNTDIQSALIVFWCTVIVLSGVLGLIGLFLLYRDTNSRLIAGLAVFVACTLSFLFWDVYVMTGTLPVALIPLFLYFFTRKKDRPSLFVYVFFAGVIMAIGHFLRSHAGTSIVLLFVTMILFDLMTLSRKALLIAMLLAGLALPTLFFQRQLQLRNEFLMENNPTAPQFGAHPFWHSVYIGLGFLKNDYGLKYADEVAFDKARSIDPNVVFMTEEYEQIIRGVTKSFVAQHPLFVIKNLLAKTAIIVLYLLVFANGGLLAAFKQPKKRSTELAFLAAFMFAALIGILVIPHPKYLAGFISLSVVYAAVSRAQRKNPQIGL